MKNTALWLIDYQERLMSTIFAKEKTLTQASILLEGFAALQQPIMYTEQYPQGLGGTVSELEEKLEAFGASRFVKTKFSAYSADTEKWLMLNHAKVVVLAGIEAHICVFQTALDLHNAGYEVWLAADATSSRQKLNVKLAQEALRPNGIKVLPVETILFYMLGDAKNPAFKQISSLIK